MFIPYRPGGQTAKDEDSASDEGPISQYSHRQYILLVMFLMVEKAAIFLKPLLGCFGGNLLRSIRVSLSPHQVSVCVHTLLRQGVDGPIF